MSNLGTLEIREGINVTMEEAIQLFIPAMMEMILEEAEQLPETGNFEKVSVNMEYHGTEYEGILQYTADEKMQTYILGEDGTLKPAPESEPVYDHIRHIKTGVIDAEGRAGTLHDFFSGTKEECLQWLQKEETIQILVNEYLYLKEYLEQQIKERQAEMDEEE